MIEFAEKLWKNQRALAIILGVILLPVVILIFATKIYMWWNEKAAETSLKETQSKDDSLKSQEDALKKAADQALNEANKAADRIENRHEDGGVDMDWNKNRK